MEDAERVTPVASEAADDNKLVGILDVDRFGGKVIKRPGLEKLAPVEQAVLERAPLPVTYDVSRPQPWYFSEFSYTEFIGGLVISPMCDELAARLVDRSLGVPSDFDAGSVVMDRMRKDDTVDKYDLEDCPAPDGITDLVVLPGSNLLMRQVSREILTRVMWERPGAFIKPHPLTNDSDLRRLRIEYGAHRIIPAMSSGYGLLRDVDTVWATGSTELAAYAVLLGKPVRSLNNIFTEKGGTYFPVFRLLADVEPSVALDNLLRALSSRESGILFAEDPAWPSKLDAYFAAAMEMREFFKPMVFHPPRIPEPKAK